MSVSLSPRLDGGAIVTAEEYSLMEGYIREAAEEDTDLSSAEKQALAQYCKGALESGPLTWDKVATVGLWIHRHQVALGVEKEFQEDPQLLGILVNPPEELVELWNSVALQQPKSLRQRMIQQISCCFSWLGTS